MINPLDGDMWKVEAINPQEVRDAADKKQVCELPWKQAKDHLPPELHRLFHINRIARLLYAEPSIDDPHHLLPLV